MHKKTWITIILLIALLASAMPTFAADGSVRVIVDNKSDSAGKLTLSGPQRYSFDLKVGKNRFSIMSGTYSYSFYGCGRYQYGTFDATKNNAKLALDCEAAAGTEMIALRVNNQSGSEFTLVLSGDGYYRLAVKKGANVFQIKAGQYAYSYDACGTEEAGKLKSNAKGANLNIKKCKASRSASSAGSVRIKFKNETGNYATVYLSGPENYTLTIPPGNSSIKIARGEYSYTVATSCHRWSGSYNFNRTVFWRFRC